MLVDIQTSESLITGPVEEPMTLEDAKLHLRFKSSTEDALFGDDVGRGWIADGSTVIYQGTVTRDFTTSVVFR